MNRMRFKSLQVRLAVRLAALYVAATAVAAGVLIYQAYDTATSLNDRELSLRAEDLARAVSRDGSGAAQLTLSPKLASGYAASTDDIFAVRDSSGGVLAASPPEFGEQVSKWPLAKDDPSYFHLTNLGSTDYYGLSVELASAAGPVSISVARTAGANDLVSSLLRAVVFDVAWRPQSAPIPLPFDCRTQIFPPRSSRWSMPSTMRSTGSSAALWCNVSSRRMLHTSCALRLRSSPARSMPCKETAS
jgi:hypothetical protein